MKKQNDSEPNRPAQGAPPEEEFGHLDDAVIGRAFRRSGLAFGILVLLGAGLFLWMNRKPGPSASILTPFTSPVLPDRPLAEAPTVTFTDVTQSAGITFRHVNGATGDKLLPETMGGGVAFFDLEGDQDPDLFFVNATYWPWDNRATSAPAPTMELYRNDGQGQFENVTGSSGLGASFYGMGVAAGDYNNDGLVDLFVSAVGPNHLFQNLGGGQFKDVTETAGVAGAGDAWSTSSAWLDIDNDGDLDLFVCNYVRWSKEIDLEVGYKIDGLTRAYGQPMNFEGTFPSLYQNNGDGSFTDISESSGVQIRSPGIGRPMAKSLGVAPVDLDNDGLMDLVVANDTVQNYVFHNQGNRTFKEIGALAGIAFDSYGNTRGAMGIDTARFRNDQSLGIAIGNFANEMTALYVSQNHPLLFADEAITEGVGPASRLLLKFGLFFFDYDLDGRQDLLTANGHLEEEISKIQKSQSYAQPAQLFWNCGPDQGPCFVNIGPDKAGHDLFQPIVGRGSAYADIDSDGDTDVVLTQIGGPPLLLRNDQSLGHRWFRLKLVGRRSNRDAIGAWVRLDWHGRALWRQVMPTRSYLSQSELALTFGLGSDQTAGPVEILWPDGTRQTLENFPVNTLTVVEQTSGLAAR